MTTLAHTDRIGRRSILVVEDDPSILEVMRLTLENEGYSVDTAASSQAALVKSRRRSYDLVILDLMLPDGDGVILHGKLRKESPGIERRTIFMTGFTSREPVISYLKSLSAGFIHKPFGPAELLEVVARVDV